MALKNEVSTLTGVSLGFQSSWARRGVINRKARLFLMRKSIRPIARSVSSNFSG